VAAVLVDLRETADVVLVDPRADGHLNDAVIERVRAVETSRDRTLTVERIATTGSSTTATVRWYVVLCALLGLGFALVVSLTRGHVAANVALGVVRVATLALISVAGALLWQRLPALHLPGDAVAIAGIGAGVAFALGAITLAFEAVLGLLGLAAMAAVSFVLAAPLLIGISPYLLPEPWTTITPWLPAGAAMEALEDVAFHDGYGAARPVLVLAGAGVLAVLALLLARWLRASSDRTPVADGMTVGNWRLWVVGVVVTLGVVMGLAVTLVPTAVASPPYLPSLASETECVQEARLAHDVADLNHEIQSLQGSPAFQGADVGADVQLQDGRFLLVFGDTLRSPDFDGPSMARNSMMLWDPDCVSVVLPGSKGALIPDRHDGVGYWPMSSAVAHRPGYDLVVVSTQRVKTTGGGSFDFANVGPALAAFVVPAGQTPQLIATKDVGPDDADTARPEWGAALAGAGGWLYLYGTARADDATTPGFTLQVARVRPDDVLRISQWRYWDGSAWSREPTAAAGLLPGNEGVSQTLSVFHQGGRWYALSKLGGDLGDTIAIWTAPGPTGPFTLAGPVATALADTAHGEVTYMPLAHPQILREPGTMVVSYSRNNVDLDKVRADPTLYRPRFLRVDLP
jgi:hypothetical protein